MARYGQFCPIAQAAEILTERWTPIVLRELLAGSRRFNEIHNGAPTMSSSLLTKRLRTLEAAGVLEHREGEYRLTRAGEELRPLIEQMAVWGERWVRREISRSDADAGLLMWAIRRSIRTEETPERVVLHFRFRAAPQAKRCWWVVVDGSEVDLCLRDPGFDVDLTVHSEPHVLASVWMGDVSLAEALRRDAVKLVGPEHNVRAFGRWFGLSALAGLRSRPPSPRRPPHARRTPSAHPSSP